MGSLIWKALESDRQQLWDAMGYRPLPLARKIHLDPHRIKLIAGGERGSKSYTTGYEIATWACLIPHKGLIWIVADTYELARNEWRYCYEALSTIGALDPSRPPSMPSVGAWTMWTRSKTEISTRSAHDALTLAGRAPDAIAMVEAAQMSEEVFLRCRGRVAQARGPLWLSGTFERAYLTGEWYVDKYNAWITDNEDDARAFSMPTWANTYLFPGGENDPEILALKAMYPPDLYMERLGATPCPPSNRVFRLFDPTKHVSLDAEFDTERPVQVWTDPGWAFAYAVLAVQRVPGTDGDNVNVIDEVYLAGYTAQQVIEIAKQRVWWPKVQAGVMDIAGKAHPGAESQEEIWRAMTGLPIVMNAVLIPDGIVRHQTYLMDDRLMGRPKLLHHPRCENTVREYWRYRYREDGANRNATEVPIDRDNHALKAIAYGLIANFGHVRQEREPKRDQIQLSFRRQ
ncbi:MAG TPA: hypothetical protein VMX14_06100 [Anaerolineae bacterium]|nr:hypothetical protein [Anaerolineae bacterium]